MGIVLEGQGQGRKEGKMSCANLACRAWENSQQPFSAVPICREPGKCPTLLLLAGPRQLQVVHAHVAEWSLRGFQL